jgi:antibiotic biosynthesis monooxygenase (ABM) superfamily enzyme
MNSKKHVLIIVRGDVTPGMEEEFNRWYDEEHIPLLLKVPGVLWARRGINTGDGQKYIAVYEHENVDVQKTPQYRNVTQTEWALKIRPHFINFKREVYELF